MMVQTIESASDPARNSVEVRLAAPSNDAKISSARFSSGLGCSVGITIVRRFYSAPTSSFLRLAAALE